MAAPSTISAVGYFLAIRAGAPAGEATLRMLTAIKGTLSLGGREWQLKGDPPQRRSMVSRPGSVVDLKIKTRSLLTGTVDGDPLSLSRAVLRPIPAVEMAQSDAGPTGAIKAVMDATPNYAVQVGDNTTF